MILLWKNEGMFSFSSAARLAPHCSVCCLQRGREGGHTSRRWGQIQLYVNGVLHLQRDCSSQLPQGTETPTCNCWATLLSNYNCHLMCESDEFQIILIPQKWSRHLCFRQLSQFDAEIEFKTSTPVIIIILLQSLNGWNSREVLYDVIHTQYCPKGKADYSKWNAHRTCAAWRVVIMVSIAHALDCKNAVQGFCFCLCAFIVGLGDKTEYKYHVFSLML